MPSKEVYIALPEKVIEKTIDGEISRLSVKYGVSPETARKIIKCESNINTKATHVNKNGSIDWGLWQINDKTWDTELSRLDWDYKNNEWDNLEAGFYIISKYGTTPWGYSRYCWDSV